METIKVKALEPKYYVPNNILIKKYMDDVTLSPSIAEEVLHYHYDWNALMLVVGRVRSNEFVKDFTIDLFDKVTLKGYPKFPFSFESSCSNFGISSVGNAVYAVLVEFIKWYNENK